MDDIRLILGYCHWIIIVGLTLGFFTIISRKYKKLGFLLPMVIIPVWHFILPIRLAPDGLAASVPVEQGV